MYSDPDFSTKSVKPHPLFKQPKNKKFGQITSWHWLTQPQSFVRVTQEVAIDNSKRVNEQISPLLSLWPVGKLGSLGCVGQCGYSPGIGIGGLELLQSVE